MMTCGEFPTANPRRIIALKTTNPQQAPHSRATSPSSHHGPRLGLSSFRQPEGASGVSVEKRNQTVEEAGGVGGIGVAAVDPLRQCCYAGRGRTARILPKKWGTGAYGKAHAGVPQNLPGGGDAKAEEAFGRRGKAFLDRAGLTRLVGLIHDEGDE